VGHSPCQPPPVQTISMKENFFTLTSYALYSVVDMICTYLQLPLYLVKLNCVAYSEAYGTA